MWIIQVYDLYGFSVEKNLTYGVTLKATVLFAMSLVGGEFERVDSRSVQSARDPVVVSLKEIDDDRQKFLGQVISS